MFGLQVAVEAEDLALLLPPAPRDLLEGLHEAVAARFGGVAGQVGDGGGVIGLRGRLGRRDEVAAVGLAGVLEVGEPARVGREVDHDRDEDQRQDRAGHPPHQVRPWRPGPATTPRELAERDERQGQAERGQPRPLCGDGEPEEEPCGPQPLAVSVRRRVRPLVGHEVGRPVPQAVAVDQQGEDTEQDEELQEDVQHRDARHRDREPVDGQQRGAEQRGGTATEQAQADEVGDGDGTRAEQGRHDAAGEGLLGLASAGGRVVLLALPDHAAVGLLGHRRIDRRALVHPEGGHADGDQPLADRRVDGEGRLGADRQVVARVVVVVRLVEVAPLGLAELVEADRTGHRDHDQRQHHRPQPLRGRPVTPRPARVL